MTPASRRLEFLHYHAAAAVAMCVLDVFMPRCWTNSGCSSVSLRSKVMRSRHEGLVAFSQLWQGFRTQPFFGPPGLQDGEDGVTVLDGWTYGMGGGAITSITADDGSRWAYEHDANSRLTKAERYDTNDTTLLHRYSYTYDDGDNLITKAVLDAVASVTTTTAFAYNDANELVSQAVGGTTTSFAYDAWGRMTSKSDGTYSAAYAYRYGNKLASVTSDFPSEGNATYQYDGAGKRRQKTAGGTTVRYRWDRAWTVVNEEDNLGDLTRTYIGHSGAHVDGSDPSTGTWRFYVHDQKGSSRGVYNSDKTQYAALEYTPYGEVYASSGSTSNTSRRYTGHDWDEAAELYYAPYRYYAPGQARWISRDPLGIVEGHNVYTYVGCDPLSHYDPTGLAQEEKTPDERRRISESYCFDQYSACLKSAEALAFGDLEWWVGPVVLTTVGGAALLYLCRGGGWHCRNLLRVFGVLDVGMTLTAIVQIHKDLQLRNKKCEDGYDNCICRVGRKFGHQYPHHQF